MNNVYLVELEQVMYRLETYQIQMSSYRPSYDMNGDHDGGITIPYHPHVDMDSTTFQKYLVIHLTPKGYWVIPTWISHQYYKFKADGADVRKIEGARWCGYNSNKQYCAPSKEIAVFHAKKRINRHMYLLEVQLSTLKSKIANKVFGQVGNGSEDLNMLYKSVKPVKYESGKDTFYVHSFL